MKIRVLSAFLYKGDHQEVGNVVDLPDAEARSLIVQNWAEPVKEDPKPQEEKPK